MTWAIIAINVVVFLYQLAIPGGPHMFHAQFGAHPVLVVQAMWPWNEDSLRIALSLLSSMFVHADIEHVALNMLFFHVFSRVVESLMGSWRFAIFYILCGLIGGLAHSLANPDSYVPIIGASGAVAGVLGAHVLLVPWDRVRVAYRAASGTVPAWGFTAIWIVLQFLIASDSSSNVAWIAHIGGIVGGAALAPVFLRAGVPLIGRSEGDVEPPSEEELKRQEEEKKESEMRAEAARAANAPGVKPARVPPPPPELSGDAPPYKMALFRVWAADPPGPRDPDERPLGEVRLPRVWAATLAAATVAIVAWWWVDRQGPADDRAQSKALEWRAHAIRAGILHYDPERAFAFYRKAAELGDPGVQARFAEILARGEAGDAGRIEAWTWYKRAAEGGNDDAMRIYADALIEGKAVPRDIPAALSLLERLSRLGYAYGDMKRGMLLENGTGIAADPKAAAKHYETACAVWSYETKKKRAGSDLACYRLARLLLAKTVTSDKPEAAKTYMRRAAEAGLDDARNAWGLWLATGDPDSADIGPGSAAEDSEAVRYFSLATAAGHADAMYNLGRMLELKRPPYEGDQGARIRALYERSAAKGHAKAKAALERLAGTEPRKG